jgi:hypothetical protein
MMILMDICKMKETRILLGESDGNHYIIIVVTVAIYKDSSIGMEMCMILKRWNSLELEYVCFNGENQYL